MKEGADQCIWETACICRPEVSAHRLRITTLSGSAMKKHSINTQAISPVYGRYALILLLAVNLLIYTDRYVLFAVFPLLKAEYHLSDAALGILGSLFMVCCMVSAPVLGWLGDRISRVKLATKGLLFWGIATAGIGILPGYSAVLAARTAAGVGEASFGTVTPGLIADYFPREKRGRIFSFFCLALPLGCALGYVLGGMIGHALGWYAAFFMVGVPGLLFVIPVGLLREPRRGGTERETRAIAGTSARNYLSLFANRSYLMSTLAMAAAAFVIGGLAQWAPLFLHREHGMDVITANTLFGGITLAAGVAGVLAGGWLGDYYQQKTGKGYLMISGWGFLLGAPVTAFAFFSHSLSGCVLALFFSLFFAFLNAGPLNAVIVNVIKPSMRAMAFAVSIFYIHALGDAVSPIIVGWISDFYGLRAALQIMPLVVVLGCVLCFFGAQFVEEDSESEWIVTYKAAAYKKVYSNMTTSAKSTVDS